MSQSDVFIKVCEVISDTFLIEESELTLGTSLAQPPLGADSLDLVRLVGDIEDALGVDVEIDDHETLMTIGSLVGLFSRKIEETKNAN